MKEPFIEVVEGKRGRYCLRNHLGWRWGANGPLGYWWSETYSYMGKIWWTRKKAERQRELLIKARKFT